MVQSDEYSRNSYVLLKVTKDHYLLSFVGEIKKQNKPINAQKNSTLSIQQPRLAATDVNTITQSKTKQTKMRRTERITIIKCNDVKRTISSTMILDTWKKCKYFVFDLERAWFWDVSMSTVVTTNNCQCECDFFFLSLRFNRFSLEMP